MKKTLILLFAILVATLAEAQLPAHFKYAKASAPGNNLVKQLLQLQSTGTAKKTTLAKERLIASEYSTNNFRPSLNIYDSSRYIYSGDNGSEFDLNQLQYDFPKTQFDYNSPMLDLHRYHISQPEIKCDTAIGKNHTTPVLYGIANVTTANYDANGMLLTYKSISTDTEYTPSLSYYNTYDGGGNVTASIYFKTPNGTSWDTATKRYFTYNGSGQLTIDSTYTRNGTTWYLSSRYEYAYDGSGHIAQVKSYTRKNATAAMNYVQMYDLSYYADGKLKTSNTSQDTGTGMYLSYVDTFGYATGYSYFNFFKEYGYTDVGWGEISSFTKKINAAGVPDTAYKTELVYFLDTTGAVIGSFNIGFKDIIIYNSHNDPIYYYDYINMGSGFTDNSEQDFYYEPATGIEKPATQYDIKVYPNPAKDVILIKPDEALKNKDLSLQLTDATGRVVRSLQTRWTGADIKMPMEDMAPGIYYLSVSDGNGTSRVEKIVKE